MWTKDIFDVDMPTIVLKSYRRYPSNEKSWPLRDFGYKALRTAVLLDTSHVLCEMSLSCVYVCLCVLECLDELGCLIEANGTSVCQPTLAAALKLIAQQISDRDNSVRSAALNAVVVAYHLVGENVFRHIGTVIMHGTSQTYHTYSILYFGSL